MDNPKKPVAVIETEPDYWSRGHFYEGKRHVVRPISDLDELPIGTILFANCPTQGEQELT